MRFRLTNSGVLFFDGSTDFRMASAPSACLGLHGGWRTLPGMRIFDRKKVSSAAQAPVMVATGAIRPGHSNQTLADTLATPFCLSAAKSFFDEH